MGLVYYQNLLKKLPLDMRDVPQHGSVRYAPGYLELGDGDESESGSEVESESGSESEEEEESGGVV